MDGKKVYKSMYEWLNMWAEQYGSHEALCDNKGSYSYESLNTSVKNLSIGFADMGLRKSDKVILQLDNCNEFVIVCFALMSMGVIPILAVPGLRVNDLDIIAKKANPVMYIRPDEYMGFIYAETGRKLQIMNPSIKYVLGTSDINKMMEQSNNSAVEIEQPKAEDIGLILLSGGTTNIPKLIPVTHYAYLLSLNETKLLGSTMSSIIILLLNVICFKMFDKIAADAEIKRKNDIYKQSIDIYKREMEEREEHNEKLRRFRHDIKNHLIAIEKLALSKEYDRLRDYIHQLTDEKGVLQVTTISGNALIDGLLADKFDVARKYEIAVEYHIEIPTKLPFDDADLCIIVGNALDNAIDGTKDIEGAKKIEISMGFKQGNFLLKVKNTFNPELIKFDNNGKRLRTSKTDKSNHGMGIGLIEETALKYNGLMEITMNENLFCLSVLLYQN